MEYPPEWYIEKAEIILADPLKVEALVEIILGLRPDLIPEWKEYPIFKLKMRDRVKKSLLRITLQEPLDAFDLLVLAGIKSMYG